MHFIAYKFKVTFYYTEVYHKLIIVKMVFSIVTPIIFSVEQNHKILTSFTIIVATIVKYFT